MVEESRIPEFAQWLPGALLGWVITAGVLALAGLVIWLVIAIARYGPDRAADRLGRVLAAAIPDLGLVSPRRVAALAWLAIKESIRRWVLVVVVIFMLLLLFAGWYLDPGRTNPARLYLGFVLTSTGWLITVLALFLSALSLPADIKNRTIYTVVTKPVRPSEIVLGRILGFGAVGTALLLVMALISYVFVIRGLSHTHEVAQADLKPDQPAKGSKAPPGWHGQTSIAQGHRHEIHVDAQGRARLEMERGHWHPLTLPADFAKTPGAKAAVETGPPEGLLLARVPVTGELHFIDRRGNRAEKGVNTGDEWAYRSYIEGGSLSAAVWEFENIAEERFPDGLPVELTILVFRTHKGDIEKGIPGSLTLRNPTTGLKVEARIFTAKKFATDVQFIPRTLQGPGGRPVDLFHDLVADGKLEISLRCLAPMQYFGVARNDLYLRSGDVPFWWNFSKGYLGIWLQMMLVTMFGVLFSTFLGGPIALLATLMVLVMGMSFDYVRELALGQALGGGPIESAIRIQTHQNLVSEMEAGVQTTVAKNVDVILEWILRGMVAVVPDFSHVDYAGYVAEGYNVPPNLVATHMATLLGFLLPIFVAAYFFLKTREVAQA